MDNEEMNFWTGLIVGGILAFLSVLVTDHKLESDCQTENNVADCTWVLVPTIEKE
jgi:hypothetical protein